MTSVTICAWFAFSSAALSLGALGACSTFRDGSDAADGAASADGNMGHDAEGAVDSGAEATLSPYAALVLDAGPVGYWRLNDTDNVAMNEVDGGPNGVYASPSGSTLPPAFVQGVPGAINGDNDRAVAFDGGFITVAGGPTFDGKHPFTIEAWVLVTGKATKAGIVSNDMADTLESGVVLQMDTGLLSIERWRAGNADRVQGSLGIQGFTHVVATYDSTNMKLFVDGKASGSLVPSSNDLVTIASFTIGARYGGKMFPFGGTIDEVAVYATALSEDVIVAHYQTGTTGH